MPTSAATSKCFFGSVTRKRDDGAVGDAEFCEQRLCRRDLVGFLGDIDMGEHERRIGGERAEHLDGGTVVKVVEATAKRFAIQCNAALPGRGAGGLQQGGVAAERHLHVGGIEALKNVSNRRVGGGATPF